MLEGDWRWEITVSERGDGGRMGKHGSPATKHPTLRRSSSSKGRVWGVILQMRLNAQSLFQGQRSASQPRISKEKFLEQAPRPLRMKM